MKVVNNIFSTYLVIYCAKKTINIISKPQGTKNPCHDPFNVLEENNAGFFSKVNERDTILIIFECPKSIFRKLQINPHNPSRQVMVSSIKTSNHFQQQPYL